MASPVDHPRGPAAFDAWVARARGRRLGAFPDEWRARTDLPLTDPASIAVVVHVFYPDLLPELCERLRRIPLPYDLWITNASNAELVAPDDLGAARNVRVLEVENRGRDLLPLVGLVNAGYLDPYSVVLKVHTKRSEWRAAHASLRGDGDSWRDDLLDAVLGGAGDIASILSAFAQRFDLGLVTADDSVLGPDYWGDNEATAAALLRRLELSLDPSRLRFAAGSVYWARGFVLQALRALDLGPDDFEPEEGQVNATTAHAVERLVGLLAVEAGLEVVGRSSVVDRASTSHREAEGPPRRPRARLVAFYLPQFHPIPENDRWWGEGFTEWTNVTAAQPVYHGHEQPRLPRDLGFYDLRLDETRRAQLSLAESAGISGFAYYYYWFAGKRLLDAPIEALLGSDLEQPFCLMWANENWTRRWDGAEADVLVAQDYERVPAASFIDDVVSFLADPRYLTIDGRKLVAIYKPGLVPELRDVISAWRAGSREAGLGELFVAGVDFGEGGGIVGLAADHGLDGLLGFPPHNHLWQWLPHDGLRVDPRFQGNILSYEALVADAEQRLARGLDTRFFPGVMVAFDNTPRRQWAPDLWYGSNPYTFRRWLAAAVAAVEQRPFDERLVFVNAWNEWAESAALEPTSRFGRSFLLAVRDVLVAPPAPA